MKVLSILLYTSFSIAVLSSYNSAFASYSAESSIDAEMESFDSQRQMGALLDMEPKKSLTNDGMTDQTTKSMTPDTLPKKPFFVTQEMIDQDLSKSLQTTLIPEGKMIEENAKKLESDSKLEVKKEKEPLDRWELAAQILEDMAWLY